MMGNKKIIGKKKEQETVIFDSTQDLGKMIQERAYRIWERKGRPQNTALEDWLQAEREFKRKR